VIGQYFFDGDEKRVKKIVPGTGEVTIFVYDAGAKLIAEYSTVVAPVENAKVAYLTADHLGSPRILTDANGQVISRRDFLPFGEEINSGTGGRNSAQGYGGQDNIRQKFTGYERDAETDLDFAQARMYMRGLGRFTSTDSLLNSGRPEIPQSWNRFTYSINSPIRFNDKTGLFEWDSTLVEDASLGKKENERRAKLRQKILDAYDKAKAEIAKAMQSKKLSAEKLEKLNNALNALGPKPGEAGAKNGVTIGVGVSTIGAVGETSPTFTFEQKGSEIIGSMTASVTFSEDFINSKGLFAGIVHEGSHVNDALAFSADISNGLIGKSTLNLTQYQTERNAFLVTSYLFEAMGQNGSDYNIPVWNNQWAKVDSKLPPLETSRSNAIDSFITANYRDAYNRPIASTNQGSTFSDRGILRKK
jgi:RHS repeat-associated protein